MAPRPKAPVAPYQIKMRRAADLIPYARNARTHSDSQIDKIVASIREFGWTNPILLDGESGITAGHGRLLAARRMGEEWVPTIQLAHLSAEQRRAYILADNKLALDAGWDDDLLRLELGELTGLGFNIALTGFSLDDIKALEPGAGGKGPSGAGNLADKFGIPPFSVLNAREGWWQSRKAAWIAIGIQSELGRGEGATGAANAVPGGSRMPGVDKATGKIVRTDSRARPIAGT